MILSLSGRGIFFRVWLRPKKILVGCCKTCSELPRRKLCHLDLALIEIAKMKVVMVSYFPLQNNKFLVLKLYRSFNKQHKNGVTDHFWYA